MHAANTRSSRIALLTLLFFSLAVAGISSAQTAQSKGQQTCTNLLSVQGRKIASTVGGEWCRCLKLGNKGKAADVEACVAADDKQKISKAETKLADRAQAKCVGVDKNGLTLVPPFAAADIGGIADAGRGLQDAILHGVFGPDLDTARPSGSTDQKCQLAVAAAVKKCQFRSFKEFQTCKKLELKAGSSSAAALTDSCMGVGNGGQPDPNGKITKFCVEKFDKLVDQKCVSKGASLSVAAPGCADDDPDGLRTCARRQIDCEACRFLNDVEGLSRDCDLYDDTLANDSCPTDLPALLIDPADLDFLADDALAGRENNTQGSVDAQEFLIDELIAMGAVGLDSGQTGRDAFQQAFTLGTNILGLIPGTDPNSYVMVGGHYDHHSTCATADAGDTICNGATDNATGVAEVLAIGRALAADPSPPARSVILAFWDREEDGLLGSAFYVANPLVPLAQTTSYINFDIQGANLLPSLRDFSVAIGAETGGAALGTLVDDAIAGEGLGTQHLSFIFGQGRSDYVNLVNGGVPTVFFSDSTGGCYHTAQDDVDVVDFSKLEKQGTVALKLARSLIDTPTPPPFAGTNPALATFADALVINDVMNSAVGDLALFSPADQQAALNFQAQMNAIVAAGEGSFDGTDINTLLLGTLNLVSLVTRQPCDGFLLP